MLKQKPVLSPSRCDEAPQATRERQLEVTKLLGLALARALAAQPHGSDVSHEGGTSSVPTCIRACVSVNADPSQEGATA